MSKGLEESEAVSYVNIWRYLRGGREVGVGGSSRERYKGPNKDPNDLF